MIKKETCLRVARWALQIEEFNYVIEHRPGTSMRHVDALTISRNPPPICLFQEEKDDGLIAQIKSAQEDEDVQKIEKQDPESH